MNSRLGLVLVAIGSIICCPAISKAQWTEISPPSTSDSLKIFFENDTLFCTFLSLRPDSTYTGGQFYKSEDDGAHWQLIFDIEQMDTLKGIISLIADPSGCLYMSMGTGIYRSCDNGESWTDYALSGISSVITPGGPIGIFARTSQNLFLVQDDRMTTISMPSDMFGPYDAQFINGNLYIAQFGIYKSSDLGENWTRILDPLSGAEDYLGRLYVTEQEIIYIMRHDGFGVGGDWIFRSLDYGQTFTQIRKGPDNDGSLFDYGRDGTIIHTMYYSSIFLDISYDMGDTWSTLITLDYPQFNHVRDILILPTGELLVGTDIGLLKYNTLVDVELSEFTLN